MKHVLRAYLSALVSVWLVGAAYPPFVVSRELTQLFSTAFVFTLLRLLVEPVLKILFLPIHFLTLGILSWLRHVALLYLLTLLVPTVIVRDWTFAQVSWNGFIIPSFHLSYLVSLVTTSLAIGCIYAAIQWLHEQ